MSENLTDLEQDSSHLMEIKDTFYFTVGSSKDAEREIGDLSAAIGHSYSCHLLSTST